MTKHLTKDQVEKISAYYASMQSSSSDSRLKNDYKLAYLLAEYMLELKEELANFIIQMEEALSLDPTKFVSNEVYTAELLSMVRKKYSELDHAFRE